MVRWVSTLISQQKHGILLLVVFIVCGDGEVMLCSGRNARPPLSLHCIREEAQFHVVPWQECCYHSKVHTSCHDSGMHGSHPRWCILMIVIILLVVLALATHLVWYWNNGCVNFTACDSHSLLLHALCALQVVLFTLAVALVPWKRSSAKILGGVVVFLLCAAVAALAVVLTRKVRFVPSLSITLPSLPLTCCLFHKLYYTGGEREGSFRSHDVHERGLHSNQSLSSPYTSIKADPWTPFSS